jgi:hypothetical protein
MDDKSLDQAVNAPPFGLVGRHRDADMHRIWISIGGVAATGAKGSFSRCNGTTT